MKKTSVTILRSYLFRRRFITDRGSELIFFLILRFFRLFSFAYTVSLISSFTIQCTPLYTRLACSAPPIRIACHFRLFEAPQLVYNFEFRLFNCMQLSSSSSGPCRHVDQCGLLQRPPAPLHFCAYQPHCLSLRVCDTLSICCTTLPASKHMNVTSSLLSSASMFSSNLLFDLFVILVFSKNRLFASHNSLDLFIFNMIFAVAVNSRPVFSLFCGLSLS